MLELDEYVEKEGPVYDGNAVRVVNALIRLGCLYKDQGKIDQTEAMCERALRGKEKALGPEDTSTVDTVNNLGILYADQGKLKEAEVMYERALQGYQKALQSDNLASLNTIHALGLIYRRQGKTEETGNMFQRAVSGRKVILGDNHPDTLEVAHLLMTLPLVAEEREEASPSLNSGRNKTRNGIA